MLVLLAFALIAGAGTAVSPCVLPVLPALLSASASGGRRRPLGVVVGLTITFTATVVGLATALSAVGLGDGTLRTLAIVVLAGFGIALVVPSLAQRLERPLAALSRFGPRSKGDGFVSGLAVGGALGFVYAPCAGPILGAVISVSAAQGTSLRLVAVGLAYALGSGIVLLLLSLGGRRIFERVRAAGRGLWLQRATGVVMIVTAGLMAANLDVRFQNVLANDLPSVFSNPTNGLEGSSAIKQQLADLRGGRSHFEETASAAAMPKLPVLGLAPDFTGTQRWWNTPGDRPLSLAGLRGHVVLVDFWTYTCIDCIRTLPELTALDARYRDKGLTIVGVHTPEFSFERNAGNVAQAIAQNGIRYPVAQDNQYRTWDAWQNEYWPAHYLIDAQGRVRYVHFGEGGAAKTESAIRTLLAEDGAKDLGARDDVRANAPAADITPESYLGALRAERFLPAKPQRGTRDYAPPRVPLPLDHLALAGHWRIAGQPATAVRDASLMLHFRAQDVYLVLSSAGGRPRPVRVLLDGKPAGTTVVRGQRLYRLVHLRGVEDHHLTLRFAPGVSGYAFTFG
jgi:cytochrome c biogenesis protein CcdA/thiol-disulfide isomerase/thioredoxin